MRRYKKNYEEQLEQQISNTLAMLLGKGLLYTYNDLKREHLDKNTIRLSWNNHLPGSFNAGSSFLRLEQYKQIIDNQSYLCILFDGSLIRVSYTIENGKMIGHNLLWWPAPYKYLNVSLNDVPPDQMLSDFLEDDKWYENMEMRSLIRIDYDPRKEVVSSAHPPVHMHIEHQECRIFILIQMTIMIMWRERLKLCVKEKRERQYSKDKTVIAYLQDDVRKSLVRQYAYARKMKGLTQAEVAERAGISRTNISRFESGTYNPTLEMLVKLAAAMDLNISITLNQKKEP